MQTPSLCPHNSTTELVIVLRFIDPTWGEPAMTMHSEGLDLDRMDELSRQEAEQNLLHVWSWRGPMYELGANSLMLDYAQPRFTKAHRWGSDFYGRPDKVNIILLGIQNLASYMMLGWETGIFNQFICNGATGCPNRRSSKSSCSPSSTQECVALATS